MNGFVARYGAIYEHSPWVAEAAAAIVGDSSDVATIARVMADCVDNASEEQQLALIRAHPDLADKASVAGELTAASAAEQAGAGLDHCTPDEYRRFGELNRAYRERFGFPFIMAVRGSSRADILTEFERRLGNDRETEFETALAEIHKIAEIRLRAAGSGG